MPSWPRFANKHLLKGLKACPGSSLLPGLVFSLDPSLPTNLFLVVRLLSPQVQIKLRLLLPGYVLIIDIRIREVIQERKKMAIIINLFKSFSDLFDILTDIDAED